MIDLFQANTHFSTVHSFTLCICFINGGHKNNDLFAEYYFCKLHFVSLIKQGYNKMSNADLSKYKTIETIVGAVINGAFSLLFVFLIFGAMEQVSMQGESGLLLDSIPQGLAIGFMGAFFPSFLTRKRIRNGQLKLDTTPQGRSFLPVNPILRGVIFAVFGALLSISLFAILIFGGNITALSFMHVAILKTFWGVVLGAIVAAISIRLALRDYGQPG
ncbi:hypothetical protein EXU34_13345 [Alteromonas sp. ZYF713]|nr:hypothetical protein [Alteromonas sp. ZYF713]